MNFDGVVEFVGLNSIHGWVVVAGQDKSLPVKLQIKGKTVAAMTANITRSDFAQAGLFAERCFHFRDFLKGAADGITADDVVVLVEIDGKQAPIPLMAGAQVQFPPAAKPAQPPAPAKPGAVAKSAEPDEPLDRRKAKKLTRKK